MPCQTDCRDYSAAHRTGPIAPHRRENGPPSTHVVVPRGGACGVRARRYGGVAEWLKAHAWKACLRETVTWVRTPPPPPSYATYPAISCASRGCHHRTLHTRR